MSLYCGVTRRSIDQITKLTIAAPPVGVFTKCTILAPLLANSIHNLQEIWYNSTAYCDKPVQQTGTKEQDLTAAQSFSSNDARRPAIKECLLAPLLRRMQGVRLVSKSILRWVVVVARRSYFAWP